MEKRTSLLFGITLVILAVLALAGNLVLRLSGNLIHAAGQAWPLIVIGAGLLFCLPPFIFSKMRGLGGLFIPGLPVLTTGLLLFAASILDNWSIWSYWWPLEVLSVAVGFILAGIFMRVIWLAIPASIVGVNGLILQFCALTHLWSSWAVLWTLEFAAVGLPLLIIGILRKSAGLKLAGIILCSITAVAFSAMSTLLAANLWFFGVIGAGLILALGVYLILSAVIKKPEAPE